MLRKIFLLYCTVGTTWHNYGGLCRTILCDYCFCVLASSGICPGKNDCMGIFLTSCPSVYMITVSVGLSICVPSSSWCIMRAEVLPQIFGHHPLPCKWQRISEFLQDLNLTTRWRTVTGLTLAWWLISLALRSDLEHWITHNIILICVRFQHCWTVQ